MRLFKIGHNDTDTEINTNMYTVVSYSLFSTNYCSIKCTSAAVRVSLFPLGLQFLLTSFSLLFQYRHCASITLKVFFFLYTEVKNQHACLKTAAGPSDYSVGSISVCLCSLSTECLNAGKYFIQRNQNYA